MATGDESESEESTGLSTIIALILHALSWIALFAIATFPIPMTFVWMLSKTTQLIFNMVRSCVQFNEIKGREIDPDNKTKNINDSENIAIQSWTENSPLLSTKRQAELAKYNGNDIPLTIVQDQITKTLAVKDVNVNGDIEYGKNKLLSINEEAKEEKETETETEDQQSISINNDYTNEKNTPQQTTSSGNTTDFFNLKTSDFNPSDLSATENELRDCCVVYDHRQAKYVRTCNCKITCNKMYYWYVLCTQFELIWGFGSILNSIILFMVLEFHTTLPFSMLNWAVFETMSEYTTSLPIGWKAGLFTLFAVFGGLLLLEGLFEVGSHDMYEESQPRTVDIWEGIVFRILSVPTDQMPAHCQSKVSDTPDTSAENTEATPVKAKRFVGLLFHYWMLSAVVAFTVGYLTNQIESTITNDETISVENIYAWAAIILTNILVGYKLVAATTQFMVKYFVNDQDLPKFTCDNLRFL